MEEIEVWEDSEIRLIEIDEDRYVQYGIWMEVALINHLVLQQIPQEWMNRKSQPALEIILKYHHFVGMRHGEGLTEGRPPPGGDAVRQYARFPLIC